MKEIFNRFLALFFPSRFHFMQITSRESRESAKESKLNLKLFRLALSVLSKREYRMSYIDSPNSCSRHEGNSSFPRIRLIELLNFKIFAKVRRSVTEVE